METFLNIVAKDLYGKCMSEQTGLSDITVVFPNRRARLFFDDCLTGCCDIPVWSPQYITIEDLFLSQSDLKPADKIEMVTLLYRIYSRHIQTEETIDSFWSWGELMLADFDDVDRNLAPAEQLFDLLREQRELSDNSFLSKEQLETLSQFFGEMKRTKPTELKGRYQAIWSVLGDIYKEFTAELAERGIGYSGMIQRRAVETLDSGSLSARKYAFVGFNSLDNAEKKLFHAIMNAGKAMFYWDYDPAYTNAGFQHEAGLFMHNNLQEFPNELPAEMFNGIHQAKLTIVETSTDNAQVRFIPDWIESLDLKGKPEHDTAIVLADEGLLMPVLHSIPQDKTDSVNITMGYPLSQTSLYSLVSSLLDMQRLASRNNGKFNIQSISRVLSNPMVTALSGIALSELTQLKESRRMFPDISKLMDDPQLSVIFTYTTGNLKITEYLIDVLKILVPVIRDRDDDTLFQPLNQESLFRIYTQINRIHSLVESGNLDVQTETLCRLIRSVLSSGTVPFHGEPAIGMQVMGLLETRNLDFSNVLLLSAQEGVLPRNGQGASFIPYSIRKTFGLITSKERSAVASYNFHHLIQRADNVTMVYNGNTSAEGLGKGQMSRYLLQLITSGKEIKRISLLNSHENHTWTTLTVPKTTDVLEKLCSRYDYDNEKSYLSPSALNQYMDCGLKFYLAQLARLRRTDENDTEIDAAMFGTLFHKSAELTYEYLAQSDSGRTITSEAIGSLLKSGVRLEQFVQEAFDMEYFNNRKVERRDYSGIQSVNFDVITRYLRQVLRMDMKFYAPFRYEAGESDGYSDAMEVNDPLHPDRKLKIRLQGVIDRMDSRNGILRIVDYKTGTNKGDSKKAPDTIADLFPPTTHKNRRYYAFQILYYAYVVCHQPSFRNSRIAPVLLYTGSISNPTSDDLYYKIGNITLTDFRAQCEEQFGTLLHHVIQEIFDPDIPFKPTNDTKTCQYCDFASLCNR